MLNKTFVFALVFIVQATSLFAAFGTSGTSAGKFLQMGVNARAIGMAESYVAVTDGADGVFWNPAGLGRVRKRSTCLMHSLYLEGSFYDFASYARRITSRDVAAIGIQYLNAGSIDRTDEFGADSGSFHPYDVALSFSGARKFLGFGDENWILGVTGKLIRSRIIETATTGAADLGLLWIPFDKWSVGFAVQNVGGSLKYADEGDPLPFNLKLGTAYRLRLLTFATDLNFPRDADPNVSFGAEWIRPLQGGLWVAGRSGYSSRFSKEIPGFSSLHLGVGVGWSRYSIDFAWTPYGKLGNAYRLSFSSDF